MKISIIGTGYVGLVTGVCLSSIGHNITCIDIDKTKINSLNQGKSPIYEPGLDKLILSCKLSNNLFFTTDFDTAVDTADLVFIAVGTPQSENGSTDLKYIESCIRGIAKAASHDMYVVIKSTVPVGTAQKMQEVFKEALQDEENKDLNIFISSNPEFLKEGSAIEDFMNPDRIVIGTNDDESLKRLKEVYKYFEKKNVPIFYTNVQSAQLIKYAANSFNAAKISFINSLASYCEKTGANIADVADGIGLDKRIGRSFLNAGIGYGGSCFPKDVESLKYEMNNSNSMLSAIIEENEKARFWPIKTLYDIFKNTEYPGEEGSYKFSSDDSLHIAILGLAFKPNTDDIRCSVGVKLAEELSKYYTVTIYDPIATDKAYVALKDCNVKAFYSINEAVAGADIVIFCTEWDEFKKLNKWELNTIAYIMRGNIIIDGRNIFDQKEMSKKFNYYCVGKQHI